MIVSVDGQIRAFLVLQFHHFGDDGIHGSVIFHQLHGFVDHQIFQPLFPHGLFITGLFLLGGGTLVIGIHFPDVADTALSKHQRTAMTAEQLGGEQVVILCLSTGRGFLVFQHLLLYIVEKLYGHDRWNRIGNQDVPVFQLADVAAVAQHVLNDIESH